MECRLLSIRPGRLPWPSIDLAIHVAPTSVISGVKSLDWPWLLVNALLRVGVLRGNKEVHLGTFPAIRLTVPQKLEFTVNLGYDGLAVIESARKQGDVHFRMWGYFTVAWFSPDEEGQHFVAPQDKSGGIVQEENRDTVRIPLSDWESTYLPTWGQQAPLIVSIADPVLLEALRLEAESLDMMPSAVAIEILRRRLLERLSDVGDKKVGS